MGAPKNTDIATPIRSKHKYSVSTSYPNYYTIEIAVFRVNPHINTNITFFCKKSQPSATISLMVFESAGLSVR